MIKFQVEIFRGSFRVVRYENYRAVEVMGTFKTADQAHEFKAGLEQDDAVWDPSQPRRENPNSDWDPSQPRAGASK